MQISEIIDYAATPDEVFVMIADEDFQNRKCVATGALRHTVSIRAQGDQTIITSTRDMPSDRFPSFVRSIVGETLAVTETQEWGPSTRDGARHGKLTVHIHGAPITLHATLSLAAGGLGTVEDVEGDLRASIPILGGKVEQAAAPAIQAAIRIEGKTGKIWFAER
jgi:uncharacterized protein YndB with AHSA1/START domain